MRRLAILLIAVVAAGALTVTTSPPAAAVTHCSSRTIAPPGPHPASREISLTVCKGDVLVGDHSYFELAIRSAWGTRCLREASGAVPSGVTVTFAGCHLSWAVPSISALLAGLVGCAAAGAGQEGSGELMPSTALARHSTAR